MPILSSYHVTLDRSCCDQANLVVYITHFLVKNRVCQVLQHATKQSETIHSPMDTHLTAVFGSHVLAAIFWFSGMLPSNCSIKWLLAVKFHV